MELHFFGTLWPRKYKKIDSVKVDARTVNDVKVSKDGRISVISREGASNEKRNNNFRCNKSLWRKILSEYTKNLTGYYIMCLLIIIMFMR